MLVVGASNQWFSETLTVLAVPHTGASALRATVAELADSLAGVTNPEILAFALTQPGFAPLRAWPAEQVWETLTAHRAAATADVFVTMTHDEPADQGAFQAAVMIAAERLPADRLRTIAEQVADGWPDEAITWAAAGDHNLVTGILRARRTERLPAEVAAAYLRGATYGYAKGRDNQRVEVVFSGPTSAAVPVRATAAVLADLIGEARRELVLVTYSARPYRPVIEALRAALLRGVTVDVVVETLAGAGTALAGAEPAEAFTALPGARLWQPLLA